MEYDWDPSLSVGEEKIDEQHRTLISQIQKLSAILSSIGGVDMSQLRSANNFLYVYIKEHFSYEESVMEKVGYPDIALHRKLHQKMIKFYEDFQKELREEMKSKDFSSFEVKDLLTKINDYLKAWVNHIRVVDHKYAKYIKK